MRYLAWRRRRSQLGSTDVISAPVRPDRTATRPRVGDAALLVARLGSLSVRCWGLRHTPRVAQNSGIQLGTEPERECDSEWDITPNRSPDLYQYKPPVHLVDLR